MAIVVKRGFAARHKIGHCHDATTQIGVGGIHASINDRYFDPSTRRIAMYERGPYGLGTVLVLGILIVIGQSLALKKLIGLDRFNSGIGLKPSHKLWQRLI